MPNVFFVERGLLRLYYTDRDGRGRRSPSRRGALDRLYDRHPVLERLGRRLAEQAVTRKERREQAFLELDATQRSLSGA